MSASLPRTLRLGTRGSPLALRQSSLIQEALTQAIPGLHIETQIIRTRGDEPSDDRAAAPTSFAPEEGSFVRAIELALIGGRIDLAVHSAKDMPSAETEGLTVAAFPPRADPHDVLITHTGSRLADLPSGAHIGTGSPRRQAAVHAIRPDLLVDPIRGNVDTRLRRVAAGDYDGVILAAAGLARLGRENEATESLDLMHFIPAVGQGILAVQVRTQDEDALRTIQVLDDATTRACALAERAVALTIQAGCHTPLGAYAHIEGATLFLRASLLPAHGADLIFAEESGGIHEAAQLGAAVGHRLLNLARAT